jgi:hypothetical protein
LAFATLAALVATALPAVAAPSSAASTPSKWDPRVALLAKKVERLRGLKFEHAVPVEFLSDATFDSRVTVDRGKLSANDRDDLRRAQDQLRAVGLVNGDIDLVDAVSSLQTSGVLAYYDPKRERVSVRGTEFTPALEVTLAHELTHALQDQHFDLQKLQKQAARAHASAALTALVEGDAVRVQNLYLAQMSGDAQQQYQAETKTSADRALAEARAKGVPDSLIVLFQSPYLLGPTMLGVVDGVEGAGAIDGLFRAPPRTDSSYLTPTTLIEHTKPIAVAPPALSPGEQADGKPDVFGGFALYLLLASRMDPVAALSVADGWGGDAMVTLQRAGTTCIRATFVGHDDASGTTIGDALQQWASAGPAGAADVARDGSRSTLTACAPAAAASVAAPDHSLAALTVATARDELLAEFTKEGIGVPVASCTANGVVADPAFRPLLDQAAAHPNDQPDASVVAPLQQRVAQVAATCAR